MKFNKVKYCLTIIFRSILITTKKIKHVKVGAIIIFIFFFGLLCYFLFERLLFHFRIGQCAWPVLNISNEDKSITKLDKEPVRALILTDLHLIGPLLGSKFEAIHKDWQMYHMFQTSINVLKPEVVFVLGDLTDEAQYSSDEEFNNFVDRFYKLFAIPDNIKMYVISGNHDIGFHYRVKPLYIQRFEKSFKSPIAQLVSIRSNHFVLLNNIGLEEDGCFLCNATETQIGKIEHLLQCSRGDINCDKKSELSIYTKPILLQHFPLYRPSDEDCEEPDSAPFPEKTQPFKEQWDCLGKNATNKLLKQIKPRLVFSGHTHHGCTGKLPDGKGIEITLPSFNWRHKNNPGFGLLVSSSNNYAFSKCYMPTQSASLQRFIVVVICMVLCMYTAISKISDAGNLKCNLEILYVKYSYKLKITYKFLLINKFKSVFVSLLVCPFFHAKAEQQIDVIFYIEIVLDLYFFPEKCTISVGFNLAHESYLQVKAVDALWARIAQNNLYSKT